MDAKERIEEKESTRNVEVDWWQRWVEEEEGRGIAEGEKRKRKKKRQKKRVRK